jgi:PAS domain S-box-containing protein
MIRNISSSILALLIAFLLVDQASAQTGNSSIVEHSYTELLAIYGGITAFTILAGLLLWWWSIGYTIAARKKSDREYLEGEERFRALAEISSDFFWEMDAEFLFTRFYGQGTEKRLARYIGKKRWESATEEDAAEHLKWVEHKKTLEAHEPFRNFEFQVGTTPPHWDSISGQPLFDEDGKFTGYVGSTTNITARKTAELALLESEERLSLSLASGGIGTFSWDIKSGTHYWDDRNHEIWGIEPGTYIGDVQTDFLNNIHPDDVDYVRESVAALLAGTGEYDTEYRIVRPDKKIAHVHAAAIVTRDAANEPLKLIGVSHDITERKEAQEALAKSERNYRLMLESSPVGVGSINMESSQARFANSRLLEIMGVTREELFSRTKGEYWANPGDREEFIKDFQREGLLTKEVELVKPDGTPYWCVLTWQYNPALEGDVLFWVYDISDRKEAEAEMIRAKNQAEAASNAKSEFLSAMSHELRTPLNSILGFGQILEADLNQSMDEDQIESIHQIIRGGRHLLELINGVLDLSRIEVGHIEVSMTDIRIGDVLDECLSLIETQASDQNISVTLDFEDFVETHVRADLTRFRQVLINLLSNAIKYNKDAGSITISCSQIGDNRLRTTIADTGPGIAADVIAQVFEPFERLGFEDTIIEGTGIGLTISKMLTELMNGSIGVESEIGSGSRFWVDMDICDAPPQITHPAENFADRHETGFESDHTVLYIEDNPANLMLMEKIVARVPNLSMISSNTAEHGLEIAAKAVPDIIMMDINLPGMNGFEALVELRKNTTTSHIPIIAVSANAMPDDIEKGRQLGFERYLTKPIVVQDVLDAIQEAVQPDGEHIRLN